MKVKITITGEKVHGVGYRVKLINIALEYGIDRFSVFNTFIDGKEAVVCLIDAPDEIIELFKQRIEAEKPEKAIVEEVKQNPEKYYGKVVETSYVLTFAKDISVKDLISTVYPPAQSAPIDVYFEPNVIFSQPPKSFLLGFGIVNSLYPCKR